MMKRFFTGIIPICAALSLSTGFSPNTAWAQNNEPNKKAGPTLLNRIDFGNSYIYGQSIKSGAVYLLQRKKSEIKSMLKCRADYRKEILEDFSIMDLKIQGMNGARTSK
jgi:hypothetical protein